MRVTGFGGFFFKSSDPERLYQWYEKHLGMKRDQSGGVMFNWADDPAAAEGVTVWTIFPQSSTYFGPGTAPFMINLRVEGLKELLAKLRSEGVLVDDKYDESEYGNFGWITDLDGNRIELWEPPTNKQE
jgi:catechol 2,3-dioxygenase-like lactoylglutathione lyase family enzyme